jgi:hypothetical protein
MLDRFLVIDYQPLASEWLEEARRRDVWGPIRRYIDQMPVNLLPPDSDDMEPGGRYQSPRSWINLSDVVKSFQENGDDVVKDPDYLGLLAIGYLGATVGLDFISFLKKECKIYKPEDILDSFGKYKEEFEAMDATEISYYNKELVKFISELDKKISDSQRKPSGPLRTFVTVLSHERCKNLFLYVKTIPRETAMGFWADFLKESPELSKHWLDSNKPVIGNFFVDECFSIKGFDNGNRKENHV